MDNVLKLAEKTEDNKYQKPIDSLKDAIADIESGDLSCNKLMVLALDDRGTYMVRFYAANMKVTEMMALMERHKYNINKMMDS